MLHRSGPLPPGETLRHRAVLNRGHGVRTRVYRAPERSVPPLWPAGPMRAAGGAGRWRLFCNAYRRPPVTTAFKKSKMKTSQRGKLLAPLAASSSACLD